MKCEITLTLHSPISPSEGKEFAFFILDMVGINKKEHEHLIQCLEELRTYSNDMKESRRIEKEIAVLSEIYDRYFFYMQSLRVQSKIYNSLYNDIRKTTYKKLRKARYAVKRNHDNE